MDQKRRSSALIFTLLIVGLIASSAFYLARSTSRESGVVSNSDASTGAYYAAEAGLEDGLARFSGDRNLEVPTCKFGTTHTAQAGDTSNMCDSRDGANFNSSLNLTDIASSAPASFPTRVRIARAGGKVGDPNSNCNNASVTNLKATSLSGCTNADVDGDLNRVVDPATTKPADDPRGFYYDLKVTSKVNKVGNVDVTLKPINSATSTDAQSVFKSGAVKDFTVDTSGAQAPTRLYLYWTCDTGACGATDFVFVTFYRTDGTTQDKVLRSAQSSLPFSIDGLNGATAPTEKIRIKMQGANSHIGMAIFDEPNNRPVFFSGTVATIQSIGYFAGTTRRLEAQVDKTAGTLLGLFDYAVYAGAAFSQPQ